MSHKARREREYKEQRGTEGEGEGGGRERSVASVRIRAWLHVWCALVNYLLFVCCANNGDAGADAGVCEVAVAEEEVCCGV